MVNFIYKTIQLCSQFVPDYCIAGYIDIYKIGTVFILCAQPHDFTDDPFGSRPFDRISKSF